MSAAEYPKVGQRVICIDDSSATDYIKRGARYTIARIDWDRYSYLPSRGASWSPHGVWLAEAPAHYISFYASRFKPIDERSTDISIFEKIRADIDNLIGIPGDLLKPERKKERA